MKATVFDQVKVTLQLLLVAVAYVLLSYALLSYAEGLWLVPAALVMAFFLPVLVSSVLQFYWRLCLPTVHRIFKMA